MRKFPNPFEEIAQPGIASDRTHSEYPSTLLKKPRGFSQMSDNRSIRSGRDMVGNVNTTGDRNKVDAEVDNKLLKANLPSSDSVDVSKELAEMRSILERLGGENANKISRALDDAVEEAKKPKPNEGEVGTALTRALDYAKKSNGFIEEASKLTPHLINTVAWLGSNWHHLLSAVGVSN